MRLGVGRDSKRPVRDQPSAGVFAPEAHRPRHWRLAIDPAALVLEDGFGAQVRVPWTDCDAVLRFPDRCELVLNGSASLVVRADDWFRGAKALALIDRIVPAPLRVVIPTWSEPDPTPYRLSGLATWSSVVLLLGAAGCVFIASVGLCLGVLDRRASAVVVGLGFLLPVPPLLLATRRRLAVPPRWREAASTAGRARVSLDHGLARSPSWMVKAAVVGLPLAGGAVSLAWWLWVRAIPTPFVVCGAALGFAASFELRRRRRRQAGRTTRRQHDGPPGS